MRPRNTSDFGLEMQSPVELELILLTNVIVTLAVASLIAQFSGIVPEDSRLHVIDLVQAVHAAPVGAG